MEKIHMEYASAIQYNDENSLSSVLTIAYLSAMPYQSIAKESVVERLRKGQD